MSIYRSFAISTARNWLADNCIVIDTETTGLHSDAEICDIAVLDGVGEVIINTLVKPTRPIPADATAIHGITDDMVSLAPTFAEVWPLLHVVIRGKIVAAYNMDFDNRMIHQSLRANGYSDEQLSTWRVEYKAACIMKMYAQYYGDMDSRRGSFRWQSLAKAASCCEVPAWNSHRALGDARAARAVLAYMAAREDANE